MGSVTGCVDGIFEDVEEWFLERLVGRPDFVDENVPIRKELNTFQVTSAFVGLVAKIISVAFAALAVHCLATGKLTGIIAGLILVPIAIFGLLFGRECFLMGKNTKEFAEGVKSTFLIKAGVAVIHRFHQA